MDLLDLIMHHLSRISDANDHHPGCAAVVDVRINTARRAIRSWERNNANDMVCLNQDDQPRGRCPSDSKGART